MPKKSKAFIHMIGIALLMTLILICALPPSSFADEDERFVKLSNKTMLTLLKKSGYSGWELYQPGSREVETNTSSKSFLKDLNRYPVVARKDDQVHLIILQKVKKEWKVDIVNEKALIREGFTLYDFTMDENVSSDDTQLYIYFDFFDASGNSYSMELDLSERYPSYFRHITTTSHQGNDERIYHTVVMNFDRGFDFQISVNGGDYTCRYSVEPRKYYDFSVESYSFAECPLSIEELATSAKATNQQNSIDLFLFPFTAEEPAVQISGGTIVEVAPLGYGDYWMIVFHNGKMYFTESSNIELIQE